MRKKLKQPTRYTHENLQNQSERQSENNEQQNKNNQKQQNYKHKKIIKKKHQPSAIRLNKINQTFQNIYQKSDQMLHELNVDLKAIQQLAEIKDKHKCLCDKNVKFYCLKCIQKVCTQPFPEVTLPFNISVIHHSSQKINKSSALPLTFLTKQVNFHYFSSLEEQKNNQLWLNLPKPGPNTYILFPHKDSKLIQEIASSEKEENSNQIKDLIILDCTWFQTDQLLDVLRRKGYQRFIRIEGYKSLYWRYNHHNDQALSSVEAITFFMREYQKAHLTKKEQKEENNIEDQQKFIKNYDNLLFLFCLNLKMIQKQEETRQNKN